MLDHQNQRTDIGGDLEIFETTRRAVLGIADDEQLQLGASGRFWELIRQRRKERTRSRDALEQMLDAGSGQNPA